MVLVGPFTLASMSGKEAPKKKIREEGSFTEIMTLLSEITDTELRKDQADISATKESSGLVTETVETTDPQDTKDAVLMMLQDLIELIRKNCNKKEKDFLNLELSAGVGVLGNTTLCREGSLPDIVHKIARQVVDIVGACEESS